MNRRERRRRAKLGDIVETKFGRVVFDIKPGEDTSKDICFMCDRPATAWWYAEHGGMAHGFASIDGNFLLLCEQCFAAEERSPGALVRKYLNAPDMKISEGGTYDDIDEIRQIADAIKDRGDKPTN
jgi:hypothetical protein